MKNALLIAAKLSIVILAISAVVITLVTGNREYFRGMVFAACLYQFAVIIRVYDAQA